MHWSIVHVATGHRGEPYNQPFYDYVLNRSKISWNPVGTDPTLGPKVREEKRRADANKPTAPRELSEKDKQRRKLRMEQLAKYQDPDGLFYY